MPYRNLSELQASLHSEVFAGVLGNRPGLSGVATTFPKISYGPVVHAPPDAKGKTAYAGATAHAAEVYGLETRGHMRAGGGPFSFHSVFKGGDIPGALRDFRNVRPDVLHVALPWERYMFRAISGKAMAGDATNMAPVVPVKQMLHRFFPDVSTAADETTAESVEAMVRGAAGRGGISAGSSMDFLDRARRMILEEQHALFSGMPGFGAGPVDFTAQLSATQTQQMVFYGSAMRAMEAGDSSPFGMKFFKNMLARYGVQGLSDSTSGVFSATDPYVLGEAIKGSTKGWTMYATASGAAPGVTLPEFYDRIEHLAGSRYRQEFETITRELMGSTGGRLAMALDEAGSPYLGVTGSDLTTFKPVPIGFADDIGGIGASAAGMPSGLIKLGGRMVGGRPFASEGMAESPAILGLRTFFRGTQQVAGATPENIGVALDAGAAALRKASLIPGVDSGHTFSKVTDAIISQGQVSLYPSLYSQASVGIPGNQLEGVNKALSGIFRDVARGKIDGMGAFRAAVESAVRGMPASVKSGTSAKLLKFSAVAWPAIKHELTKGNVLPTEMMERLMFLPGALSGERAMTKGTRQRRGIREVVGVGAIRRRALGATSLGGRISPVGLTLGEHKIGQALRSAYTAGSPFQMARGLGSQHVMMGGLSPVAVIPGASKTAGLRMFGDAGALLTPLGQKSIGYEMSAARQLKEFLSTGDLVEKLEDIAGKHLADRSTGWHSFIQRIREQGARPGFLSAGEGLRIDPGAIGRHGLSLGTTHFMGVNLGEYDAQRTLAFGAAGPRAHMSTLLAGSARITAAAAGDASYAARAFGGAGDVAHMVMGADTFSSLDPFEVAYGHRTGLLATGGRDTQASVPEFLRRYKQAGGVGLGMSTGSLGERTLVATQHMTRSNFMKASAQALLGMGFSGYEIQGQLGAMTSLLGGGASAGHMSAEQARRGRMFLMSNYERMGASEDIIAQGRAFGIRLQTLNQVAQGSSGQGAIYRILARRFQQQVNDRFGGGLVLNSGDLSPAGYVKSVPQALKNPFAPLVEGPSFLSWAGSKGIDVLSPEEVARRFGNEISTLAMTPDAMGAGMEFDALMSTRFMGEGRQGFYLDLGGRTVPAPVNAAGDTLRSRYVYVKSGAEMRQAIRGAPGEAVRLGAETIESGIMDLVTATGSGRSGQLETAALKVLSGQFSIGKKEGYLEKHGLYANAEVAGRGRIIPRMSDPRMAAGSRLVTEGGVEKVSREVFEVGINKYTLYEMYRQGGHFDRAGYVKAVKRMRGKGYMYGALQPTPAHGEGHMRLVRFTLDKQAAGKPGQLAFRMSDFMAMTMERDFDKDAIDAMLMAGHHTEKHMIAEWGGLSQAEDALDEAFDQQRTRYASQMRSYQTTKAGWEALLGGHAPPANSAEFYRRASSLLAFGNMPPLPWIPYYAQMDFTAKIVSQQSAEEIAKQLTDYGGTHVARKYTGADVTAFQNAMDTGGLGASQVWQESVLAQQTIFQAPITKGGQHLEPLTEYLKVRQGITADVRAGNIGVEEAVQRSVTGAQKLFTAMIDEHGGLGKLRAHSTAYAGLSAAETALQAGEFVGRTEGVYAFAAATHLREGETVRNVIRYGGSAREADAIDTMRLLFPGADVSGMVHRGGTPTQEVLARTNDAIHAGAGAVSKTLDFLGDHWKGVAVVGGAILGLKAFAGAFGDDDELDAPPPRLARQAPAPLPPEPMVARQAAGPMVPMSNNVARVSPMNGVHSISSSSTTRRSVNIGEAQVAVSARSVGTNFSNVRVQDSRRYSSGWQQQSLADRHGRSDFIHDGMDLA